MAKETRDMDPGEFSGVTLNCLEALVRILEVLGDLLDADGQEHQLQFLVDQAVERSKPENRLYRIVKVGAEASKNEKT